MTAAQHFGPLMVASLRRKATAEKRPEVIMPQSDGDRMPGPPLKKDEQIARLLGKLADLSGEEEAMEAYRREAEDFDPAASTESISRALTGLENAVRPP